LEGEHSTVIKAYAMVRHNWGQDTLTVHFRQGDTVADVLRKTLDFSPKLRDVMFDPTWEEVEDDRDSWMRLKKHYRLREGWRVQLNGKNLTFNGGFDQVIQPDDQITLFSPGR
jgi:molybdopterin converting factor small subunit